MGFGYQNFHPKNNPDPLKVKKNILKYRVYYIQKNRHCNMVSTNQSVNQSEFVGLIYPFRSAKYRRFGLVQLFHSRFGGYLPAKLFLMGSSC